jgi:hypothetical protein
MIRLLPSILLVLAASLTLNAQSIVFYENFESPSLADSVASTGTPGYSPWGINSRVSKTGINCDSATVSMGDTAYLSTITFSTLGMSFVSLTFSQICKIEFFDAAEIWVSTNGGITWQKLTQAHYTGSGQFSVNGNKFTSTSYVDWLPGTPSALPSNTWWKDESFDLSSVAANSSDVKVRFVLSDANNSGPAGNAGWYIDDIKVTAAPSELIPPVITMLTPVVQDTVYLSTPVNIRALLTDISGIDTALLVYTVHNVLTDTIGMSLFGTDSFQASIPFPGFGRTVSYKVIAYDASPAMNLASGPLISYFTKFSNGNTYTLGTGTTSTSTTTLAGAPYIGTYWGNKQQYLVRSAELIALGMPAGPISSLRFNVLATNSCPILQGFTIRIGNTSSNDMASAFVSNANFTEVLSYPSGYQPATGWNIHNFTTPFIWDGISNIVVEVCHNNSTTVSSSNSSVYYSTASFTSTRYYYQNAANTCSTTNTGYSSTSRPNMIFGWPVSSPVSADLGVSQMLSPTYGVLAGQPFNVVVKVKNFGIDTVNYATINWSVDGVVQSPFSFTDTLVPGQISADKTLGTYTLSGGLHTIKAWTANPNGIVDNNWGNDTISFSFFICSTSYSGAYSIGGTGADFPDLSTAIAAINQCGIVGPVVFNIANGTYTGQYTLPLINGSSTTNTITIQSASNDSSLVTLVYDAVGANDNWVFNLNGARNIVIKGMKLEALDANFCNVIVLNNTRNISVLNNELVGTNSTAATLDAAVLLTKSASSDSGLTIQNNRIMYGYRGVHIAGVSISNLDKAIVVKGNVFRDQRNFHALFSFIDALDFGYNDLRNTSLVTSGQGVYLNHQKNAWKFYNNKLLFTEGARAVSIWNCNSPFGQEALFCNNFIAQGGSAVTHMIDMANGSGIRFFANTFHKFGVQASAANTVFINTYPTTDVCDSLYFYNNNFINSSSNGTLLKFGYTIVSRRILLNNNNYYSPVSTTWLANASSTYANLPAWRTAVSQDANSVAINPMIVSNLDLHITNYALKGLGMPLPAVTIDIDGELRDPNAPTIGADELPALTNDLFVSAVLSPATGCNLGASESVQVRLINSGVNAIPTGLQLSYQIQGSGSPVSETLTQAIPAGDTLDYTFNATANLSVATLLKDSTFNIKAWHSWAADQFQYNDTASKTFVSGYQPIPPTASSFTANYGATTTLTATSTDTLIWYASIIASTPLYTGKFYTTPILYDTVTYWVAAKYTTGQACVSSRIPVQVNVINFPPVDAGVSVILNPSGPTPSGQATPLTVRVKNYGLNNLTTAIVVYSLNNVIQDSVLWTGNLLTDSTSAFTVDTMILQGGVYNLKVWTTLPNSASDTFNLNDTASFTFNSCMQGVFTLGQQAPGQSYNFNTFNQVMQSLVAAGVCGNVTILVDTGVYVERLTINPIPGAGPNARVTFVSMNGDSTSATLRYPTSSSAAWAMKFAGADYITFKKLTLSVAGGNTFSRIMEFDAGANYNSIENCVLLGIPTTSTTNSFALIFSGVGDNEYNVIKNNLMMNGSYGIYMNGVSTNYQKGNQVLGNKIQGFQLYGLYFGYQDSVQVSGNELLSSGTASYGYGIYVTNCNNSARFLKNKVISNSTNYFYGIYFTSLGVNSNNRCLVANNFVAIPSPGTGSSYGMYLITLNNTDVYYNSVNVLGNTTTSRALYVSTSTNSSLKNNIFSSNLGFAAYYAGTLGSLSADYNNLVSSGSNLAYWNSANMPTLAAYKAASGQDQNSVSIMPLFASNNDLHLVSTNLSAKGIYLSAVPDDIDGELRALLPTIGADEVPLLNVDAGVSAIIVPGSLTFEYDTVHPRVIICNYGIDTLTSIPISYTINSAAPILFTYTGSLSQFACDTVTLPYFISPAGNSSFCVSTQIPADSNAFNNQLCKSFFGTPSYDAYLERILTLDKGCGLTSDTVSLKIKNIGGVAISGNINAYYSVNGSTAVSQAITQSIAIGDSIIFNFNAPINLAVTTNDSTYNVKAWVDLTGDNVAANDTALTSTESFHTPPAPVVSNITIPYATQATLNAVSTTNDSLLWFDSLVGGTELHQGATYITPLMYLTDTFYVAARGGGSGFTGTLGTGTVVNTNTGWPTPYGNYYWGNKEQYLIRASELQAMGAGAGPISSLGFNVQSVNSCPALQGYYLKFGHTNLTALSGWVTSGLTTVFTQNGFQPITGWNIHAFQTPFIWNGVDNVIIEVCFNNGSFVSSGNASVYSSTTPFPSVWRYNADNDTVCSAPLTGLTNTTRPNMKLEIQPTGCSSARVPLIVTVGNPAALDAGAFKFTAPVSAVNMGANETVKVKVRNYGTQSISNFPVSFRVDNLPAVTETVTGPLAPNDSLEYTFTAKANLSAVGTTYSLKAWTSLVGDLTAINDTVGGYSVTNMLPNYCPCAATSPSYEDISRVKVSNLDNYSGGVGSMYSDFTALSPAMLSIGLSDSLTIESAFSPGYSTQYNCWVNVFIDWNRDGVFDPVTELPFSKATTSQNSISDTFTVPFSALPGLTRMRVVMRETGTAANTGPCGTFTWGEAEDYNVLVKPLVGKDAGVAAITSPTSTVSGGTSVPVTALIRNFGTDTIFPGQLQVKFQLDNSPVFTVTVQSTLLSLDTLTVSAGIWPVPTGQHQLCVWTVMANDSVAFNDQKCIGVFGELYTSVPYTDNLEGTVYWNSTGTKGNWQHGAPAGTTINSAHSPTKVWMTKLAANYDNNANELLYTPRFSFINVPPTDTVTLKFWHWYNTESTNDGGHLQFSTNGGLTWVSLGTIGDALATNWYTTNIGGTHVFSGVGSGWVQSSIKLDPIVFNGQGLVQFRFRFFSNATTNNFDGWAIDDFSLTLPIQPNDVGVEAIVGPAGGSVMGSQTQVKVRLKNYGSNTQTSFPVSYSVNGGVPVSATWSGFLNTGDTISYTFAVPLVGPISNFQLCAKTQLLNDGYTPNDEICANLTALPGPFDAGITDLEHPKDSVCKNMWPKPVIVWIKNAGTNTLSSIPLRYQINSATPIVETWNGTLNPGDSTKYIFTALFMPPIGIFQICTETMLAQDVNTGNDKKCNLVKSITDCGIGFDENLLEGIMLGQNKPNPATGQTIIPFTVPRNGVVILSLTDPLGRLLSMEKIDAVEGENASVMDLSGLETGSYYYSIEFEGYKLSKRMVVVR